MLSIRTVELGRNTTVFIFEETSFDKKNCRRVVLSLIVSEFYFWKDRMAHINIDVCQFKTILPLLVPRTSFIENREPATAATGGTVKASLP